MPDMLTESQINKDNDDGPLRIIPIIVIYHEHAKVDIVVAHVGVVNKYNEKRKYALKGKEDCAIEEVEKDAKTLCEDVVSNDESIFMGCVVNSRVYRLFTNGTQSIYDVINRMTPREDEDFDVIGLDVEQVVANKLENVMLSAKEDESFYDARTFPPTVYLRGI